jgi:hypothetical protein
MRDDADYLDPFGLRGAGSDENALADRRLVREGLIRQQLVNEYRVAAGCVIRIVNVRPASKGVRITSK